MKIAINLDKSKSVPTFLRVFNAFAVYLHCNNKTITACEK